MVEFDDELGDGCPRCRVGRIQLSKRPYLELYKGHLFTVPDATCYVCDVCDYAEFDETIIELIGNMVFGASIGLDQVDDGLIYRQPPAPDDDIPTQPQPPQI